jgi:hypothetical protein
MYGWTSPLCIKGRTQSHGIAEESSECLYHREEVMEWMEKTALWGSLWIGLSLIRWSNEGQMGRTCSIHGRDQKCIPSFDMMKKGNIHVTAWHEDIRGSGCTDLCTIDLDTSLGCGQLLLLLTYSARRLLSPWWWRRYVLPKLHVLQEQRSVTSQKTAFFKENHDRAPSLHFTCLDSKVFVMLDLSIQIYVYGSCSLSWMHV